ncbi:hypothetical protein CHLRE_16g678437v5 [Chlamydomonas reinhardtii]|uniref:Cytochrome P450 n=1 Tax=Chlamydomonas reinhardtii TaxID=3055 RepID=A0A2K3CVX2_CHLRE|nr:uncharacterized protein CHLRE_16g678437v5 [Chlamydomonas reinhardtii]PNW72425.1 hypothetical protein CHLRE_16g678437v5 [Chlamydomonas reinhardtii]
MLQRGAAGRGTARGVAATTHAARPYVPRWSRAAAARVVRAAAPSPPPAQDTARGTEAAGPGPSSSSAGGGGGGGAGGPLLSLSALFGRGGGQQQQGPTPEVRVPLNNVGKVPIFQLLYELYSSHGGVFRMRLGPKSFLVLSDPGAVRQVLVGAVDKYSKGILAEILEFVMGNGLLAADGEHWIARRRVVAPALQRKFVSSQVALFGAATAHGLPQLEAAAAAAAAAAGDSRGGGAASVDMESFFSRLSLDIIGKSVFDYDFDSLRHDDPVIQAVYSVLRESTVRSTAPFPYWKLPGISLLVPRLRESDAALAIVNDTLDRLIARCKSMLEAEGSIPMPASPSSPSSSTATSSSAPSSPSAPLEESSAPTVLHFLLGSGEALNSRQLRDDLMTLLIAGHETTAAALTWALHLLVAHPEVMKRVRDEVDWVLGDRLPGSDDLPLLRYTTRVVNEALRLYPQPPVLIRRAMQDDVLPGGHVVAAGTDLFISVWNLHHSPQLWERPEAFDPDRFGPLDSPPPTEFSTDFRFLPFGGGRRKCVGDMFAIAECVVALAVVLRRYDFAPDTSFGPVGFKSGATINTSNGLHMLISRRDLTGVPPPAPRAPAAAAGAAAGSCPHAAAAAATAAAAAAVGCPHAAAAATSGAPAGVTPQ